MLDKLHSLLYIKFLYWNEIYSNRNTYAVEGLISMGWCIQLPMETESIIWNAVYIQSNHANRIPIHSTGALGYQCPAAGFYCPCNF